MAMPSIIGANLFLKNISEYLDTGRIYHIQNYKDEYLRYLEDQVDEEKNYKQ